MNTLSKLGNLPGLVFHGGRGGRHGRACGLARSGQGLGVVAFGGGGGHLSRLPVGVSILRYVAGRPTGRKYVFDCFQEVVRFNARHDRVPCN